MSGHSKWATIKRKKAATDQARGKMFSKYIKEITLAARQGGDPEMNPRLRTAITAAKSVNMPADNIKKAIQRGTGELPGVTYEEITYEGYGPGGAALIIETLTDNKNRTVGELRHTLEKYSGNLGSSLIASSNQGIASGNRPCIVKTVPRSSSRCGDCGSSASARRICCSASCRRFCFIKACPSRRRCSLLPGFRIKKSRQISSARSGRFARIAAIAEVMLSSFCAAGCCMDLACLRSLGPGHFHILVEPADNPAVEVLFVRLVPATVVRIGIDDELCRDAALP